jgi:hypothetical protein
MLITGTSDKIQFKLGANTTTTALPFTVDYNNYTSTSVSVLTNNGTSNVTNGTTAVDLVGSPSSGQQNELRYCSIQNADSVSATVIIQVYDGTNTRVVFRAVLASGDTLQYQLEKGWEIIDNTGNKKNYSYNAINSSMMGPMGWRPSAINNTATLTNNTVFLVTLGKADKPYTSIDILFSVTTSTATITWAEAAIYSGQRINGDGASSFTRRGFTNLASPTNYLNSIGTKKVAISVSGISIGEQIVLAIGMSGTPAILRGLNSTTDISDSTFGSMVGGANANWRPSLQPSIFYSAYNASQFWINWQGT